jgi:protein SCO1
MSIARLVFCSLVLLALSEAPAAATHLPAGAPDPATPAQAFDNRAALDYSQAAIGRTLGDYTLLDTEGRPVKLAAYRGKPLVLSLIYTSCYHTCPMTTQHLRKAVQVARQALGTDSFAVVTIGFDIAFDNPAAMGSFARQQGVTERNWAFLSADAATIDALSRDIGFLFAPSPKGYDHLIQATVVDGEGKVYQQVYGDLFPNPQFVEPLKQLVFGTGIQRAGLEGLLNRVRLFCTTYDPSSDRYYFDYSLFVGMGVGAIIIAFAFAFLVRETLSSRRSGQA